MAAAPPHCFRSLGFRAWFCSQELARSKAGLCDPVRSQWTSLPPDSSKNCQDWDGHLKVLWNCSGRAVQEPVLPCRASSASEATGLSPSFRSPLLSERIPWLTAVVSLQMLPVLQLAGVPQERGQASASPEKVYLASAVGRKQSKDSAIQHCETFCASLSQRSCRERVCETPFYKLWVGFPACRLCSCSLPLTDDSLSFSVL